MSLFEAKEGYVAVHVGHPVMSLAGHMFPAGNWIGGVLLLCLLKAAFLPEDLVIEEEAGATGELNDCLLLFHVREESAAVETIKVVLRRSGILTFCQIALFDEAGNWRCVFPSEDLRVNWLMDSDRHVAAYQAMNAAHRVKLDLIAATFDKLKLEKREAQQ